MENNKENSRISREDFIFLTEMFTDKTNEAMRAIEELGEKNKVELDGGLRYIKVNERNKIFRKIFGGCARLQTNLEYLKNNKAVVKAEIYFNYMGDWVLSGTGYSSRQINDFDPYANVSTCETNAIGRALASIGISGEEYASDSEMPTPLKGAGADSSPVDEKEEDLVIENKKEIIPSSASIGLDTKQLSRITKASVGKIIKDLNVNDDYDMDDVLDIYELDELKEMSKEQYEDLKMRLSGSGAFAHKLCDLRKLLEASGYGESRFLKDQKIDKIDDFPENKIHIEAIALRNRIRAQSASGGSSLSIVERDDEYSL